MDILIVSPHFYPENFRINDFAESFSIRGHNINVLTAIPDYPDGKFYEGFGYFNNNHKKYKNINVYRAPLIPRGKGTNFLLALNYISFVIGSIFIALKLLKIKHDIIFVFEPSPLTVAIPAIFIKKVKRIPICIWVLDLWPESVKAGGNLKSDIIPNILIPIVKQIYRYCDKILVSSPGFIDSIKQKSIEEKKIDFFPQWAEPIFKPINNTKKQLPNIPKNSFKIMFAGNIGEAQDFPSILKAAELCLENKNIHWIILGGGRREGWVKGQLKNRGLADNFHMLGRYPLVDMPEFYSLADAMLLSLKNEYIFSLTIPARLQSYLACAKPILAMADGEVSRVIEDAGSGSTCNAGDFRGLADNINKMQGLRKEELKIMSNNAYNYYLENFEREMLFQRAEQIFQTLDYIPHN